jgi:hypothetical protein
LILQASGPLTRTFPRERDNSNSKERHTKERVESNGGVNKEQRERKPERNVRAMPVTGAESNSNAPTLSRSPSNSQPLSFLLEKSSSSSSMPSVLSSISPGGTTHLLAGPTTPVTTTTTMTTTTKPDGANSLPSSNVSNSNASMSEKERKPSQHPSSGLHVREGAKSASDSYAARSAESIPGKLLKVKAKPFPPPYNHLSRRALECFSSFVCFFCLLLLLFVVVVVILLR